MAQALLEARSVTKVFRQRGGVFQRETARIRAVEEVNWALNAGEMVGLVGESGCGKTTLAKLLIGLLPPSAGEVLIGGEPFASLRGERLRAARRSVQFVFQDPTNSLNPRMTVEDILSEPLIVHRLATGAARRERVAALLAAVQLPGAYARRLPRELSGGERQRVGIARALATEPEGLICDEPIASLDVSVGAQILDLLRGLCRERHMALLLISHDLRAVASLCAHIAVMRQGRILESAPTDELLSHPRDPYTALLIRSAELDLDAAP